MRTYAHSGEVPSVEAVLPYLRTGGGKVCFYGFHAHHGMEDNPVHVYEFMARGVSEPVRAASASACMRGCVRQRVGG